MLFMFLKISVHLYTTFGAKTRLAGGATERGKEFRIEHEYFEDRGAKFTSVKDNPVFKHPVALLYVKLFMYYIVRQQCNKLFLFSYTFTFDTTCILS
jgi:hypothetical protein